MPRVQQETGGTAAIPLRAKLEFSLRDHATAWMYGLLAIGFVMRAWHASRTYLNPDEVLHFLAGNRPTWADMMRNQASISHPPLQIFILHAWMGNEYLGNSYFDSAENSASLFIFASTGGVLQYAMGQAGAGDVDFAAFLLGIFVIFGKPRLGEVSVGEQLPRVAGGPTA